MQCPNSEQTLGNELSLCSSTDSSFTTIGTTKHSNKEMRLRLQKTFVGKAFYTLVPKLEEKELQKLSYLSLYEELCARIDRLGASSSDTAGASPYGTQPPKAPHTALKKRFSKIASKGMVKILAKNAFQLACTLEKLWELALRLVEQQLNKGSRSFFLAEQLMIAAKNLPAQFSLFEEQKTYLHISSLQLHEKCSKKRLKKEETKNCHQFLAVAIEFGYEYFGLSEKSLDLF